MWAKHTCTVHDYINRKNDVNYCVFKTHEHGCIASVPHWSQDLTVTTGRSFFCTESSTTFESSCVHVKSQVHIYGSTV